MTRGKPATTEKLFVVNASVLYLLRCVTKVATELFRIQESEHLMAAPQRIKRLLGDAC